MDPRFLSRPGSPPRSLRARFLLALGLGLSSLLHAGLLAGQVPPRHTLAPFSPVTDLEGIVTDAEDGSPVVGAVVRLPSAERYTLTDRMGRFVLRNVSRGEREVLVQRLGYEPWADTVSVQPDRTLRIALARVPVALEGIEVVLGEDPAHRILDGTARSRAIRMATARQPPVFWSRWDRDAIEAADVGDVMEFLTEGPPRMVIRGCVGLGLPPERLCVSPPFGGMRLAGYALPAGASGRGPGTTLFAPVFLDDRPLPSLEELAVRRIDPIHRVEIYGDRGERGIRLYTEGYLRLLAEGLVDPVAGIMPPEIFDGLVLDRDRDRGSGPGPGRDP